MSLIEGLKALRANRYEEAIELLSRIGLGTNSVAEEDVIGAQVGLISAYEQFGEAEKATALRQKLAATDGVDLSFWSLEMVFSLLDEAEGLTIPRLPIAETPEYYGLTEGEEEDVTQPLVQLPPLKKIATLRSS
ncbi:MAG: hypothetical protein AAFY11_13975, partial [Cyanobacteria bacterium J06641_5]